MLRVFFFLLKCNERVWLSPILTTLSHRLEVGMELCYIYPFLAKWVGRWVKTIYTKSSAKRTKAKSKINIYNNSWSNPTYRNVVHVSLILSKVQQSRFKKWQRLAAIWIASTLHKYYNKKNIALNFKKASI
jgi:hypothetical protein